MPARHPKAALTVTAIAVLTAAAAEAAEPAVRATAALPVDDTYFESFDPQGRTSGAAIVGLSLGQASGFVDPDLIVVAATEDIRFLCVRAVTRDARFLLSAAYALPVEDATRAVRLSPFTRKHRSDLAKYTGADIALLAYGASSSACNVASPVLLPQMHSDTGEARHLTVLANSRGRFVEGEIAPIDGKANPKTLDCEAPANMAQIAFDTVCSLDALALPSGPYRLTVRFEDVFDSDEQIRTIFLPPEAENAR